MPADSKDDKKQNTGEKKGEGQNNKTAKGRKPLSKKKKRAKRAGKQAGNMRSGPPKGRKSK
jgi:hypothetical protein